MKNENLLTFKVADEKTLAAKITSHQVKGRLGVLENGTKLAYRDIFTVYLLGTKVQRENSDKLFSKEGEFSHRRDIKAVAVKCAEILKAGFPLYVKADKSDSYTLADFDGVTLAEMPCNIAGLWKVNSAFYEVKGDKVTERTETAPEAEAETETETETETMPETEKSLARRMEEIHAEIKNAIPQDVALVEVLIQSLQADIAEYYAEQAEIAEDAEKALKTA